MDYFKRTEKNQNEFNFFLKTEDVEAINKHSEKDCLYGILKNLPKKYRNPLFLADIKGLKQQEAALQLKQSLSTTKSQIQRVRKLIAKGYIDCYGFVVNNKGLLVSEIQEKTDCKICIIKIKF